MTGRLTLLGWLTTRLLALLMLFTYESRVIGDVNYYLNSLEAMRAVGLAHTLVEYPLPAVGVVAVPWFLGFGGSDAYRWLFLGFALATDALFMWVLHRAGGRNAAACAVWILMVPVLGAVCYTRFDLLPGVLVGFMVLQHRRHPRGAAVALAVATSVKLWPALLIPPLVAAARKRRDALVAIGVVGAAAVGATLAVGGWSRLMSPLGYQGDRGLQVEAVAATPAMVLRWLHAGEMRVWYAPSKAWEVSGAGVTALITLTTIASAVFVLALVVAWWKTLSTRRILGPDALVWLTLASTTGFVVLGRVLSPQYLLWLGPAAAAGLVVAESTRQTLFRWTVGLLLATGLTHLVFPVLYTPLLDRPDAIWPVAVLVLRNLAMLVLLGASTRMAWRSLRNDADEQGRGGDRHSGDATLARSGAAESRT